MLVAGHETTGEGLAVTCHNMPCELFTCSMCSLPPSVHCTRCHAMAWCCCISGCNQRCASSCIVCTCMCVHALQRSWYFSSLDHPVSAGLTTVTTYTILLQAVRLRGRCTCWSRTPTRWPRLRRRWTWCWALTRCPTCSSMGSSSESLTRNGFSGIVHFSERQVLVVLTRCLTCSSMGSSSE
jgi:hypothetical protein